jgi:hypothetical protein
MELNSLGRRGRSSQSPNSSSAVLLAALMQCAPLLFVAARFAGALGPGPFTRIATLSLLLAGSGYAVLRRWNRFACVLLLGSCIWVTAMIYGLGAWAMALATIISLLTVGDVVALAEEQNAVGRVAGTSKVVLTVLICTPMACYLFLLLYLEFACRFQGQCL